MWIPKSIAAPVASWDPLFEINRHEILEAQPPPSSGSNAFRFDCGASGVLGSFILRHEFGCPRNAAKTDLGATTTAIIDHEVTVSVVIFLAVVRKPFRH